MALRELALRVHCVEQSSKNILKNRNFLYPGFATASYIGVQTDLCIKSKLGLRLFLSVMTTRGSTNL